MAGKAFESDKFPPMQKPENSINLSARATKSKGRGARQIFANTDIDRNGVRIPTTPTAVFPLAQAFTPGSRVPAEQIARFTGFWFGFGLASGQRSVRIRHSKS